MKKVLFVCIHNSARSQMAEEILRKNASDLFLAESAGITPGKLNPYVVQILKENGMDISQKKPQSVKDLIAQGKQYDYIITVCDETSAEQCPTFPGSGERLHWGFEDPSSFQGTDAEKLDQTRAIYKQIEAKIVDWLQSQS